jgi:hypothetical protein
MAMADLRRMKKGGLYQQTMRKRLTGIGVALPRVTNCHWGQQSILEPE